MVLRLFFAVIAANLLSLTLNGEILEKYLLTVVTGVGGEQMWFDSFGLLLTTRDKSAYKKIVALKVISPSFFVNYISYEDRNAANILNRYLYKVKENLFWYLAFCVVPRKLTFGWNKAYIKKPKNSEIEEFKVKVKKYFNWTEKEWRVNRKLILMRKSYYIDLLGFDNTVRKKMGAEKIIIPKVKYIEKQVKNLEEWF